MAKKKKVPAFAHLTAVWFIGQRWPALVGFTDDGRALIYWPDQGIWEDL